MIVAGKDKGQIGTVLKVIRDQQYPRVVVEGLNLVRFFPSIATTSSSPGEIYSSFSCLSHHITHTRNPTTKKLNSNRANAASNAPKTIQAASSV